MQRTVGLLFLVTILLAVSVTLASRQQAAPKQAPDRSPNPHSEQSTESNHTAPTDFSSRLTTFVSGANPLSLSGRTAVENNLFTSVHNGNVEIYPPSSSSTLTQASDCGIGIHSWSYTGSLLSVRTGHTSTILPNGKVLIVGGADNTGLTGRAELYDPVSGTWSSAGSLATPRNQHTATLLPNGKVLIAGGSNSPVDHAVSRSAELYDPSTNTWSSTTSLFNARAEHTATLLSDGRVLVWGGKSSGNLPVTLAAPELYDSISGTWSTTGSGATPRTGHTATLLTTGKVLVVGGFHFNFDNNGINSGNLATAELYDPTSGTVSNTASLATPRSGHTATLLLNGKVLVVNGANAELYDPASALWSATPNLNVARQNHTATMLANGKVLVAGGTLITDPTGNTRHYCSELYDPATGLWSPTGNLNTGRAGHAATLLTSGKVLVTGGRRYQETLSSAELYDAGATEVVYRISGQIIAPSGNQLVALSGATVTISGSASGVTISDTSNYYFNNLQAGGTYTITATREGYKITPSNYTFTNLMSDQVADFSAIPLLTVRGHVVDASGNGLANADLFLSAQGSCSETIKTSTDANGNYTFGELDVRNFPSFIPLQVRVSKFGYVFDSSVVLIGRPPAGGTPYSAEANFAAGTCGANWSNTGNLNFGRSGHTATLLGNGKVLVAGGDADGTRAELYDASSGTWTITGSLNNGRTGHTATLLSNGKVLVVSGTSAELYDPALGTWTITGSLATPRSGHTATLLGNGKVLVVSGTSAELYDPALGTWSVTGNLTTTRSGHTATLLGNGKVLVASGTSAELYDPVSGLWTVTGSLMFSRTGPTATLLNTGKVLVAGGIAELYDPVSGTWSVTGSPGRARSNHTATLLPSGAVLVVGGIGSGFPCTLGITVSELYDPTSNTWSDSGRQCAEALHHTATLLPTGKVLVVGFPSAPTHSELYFSNAAVCAFTLNSSSASAPASGGSGSVSFTATASDCPWTAVSNNGFITITSATSGTGNGTISYSVTANPGSSAQSGTLTIAGQTFTVNQFGSSCSFTLDSTSASLSNAAGTGTVNFTAADSACPWTAVSNASFINITSATAGTGNGTISYSVSANPGPNGRTGSLTIAGQTFTVNQAGISCAFVLDSSSASLPAGGGSGSVSFTGTGNDCPWLAVSNASFISITSIADGTGNGTISYSVAANPNSNARTGTLRIAQQTFTVNQAGVSCAFVLGSSSASLSAAGGSGSVSFTGTASDCSWTAVSNASFINITSATAGTGSGTVSYSVEVNPSSNARSGTLTIAGQTFTVIQAGVSCSFTLESNTASLPAAAGTGTASFTGTAGNCPWTAVSNASFINITSATAGAGTGTVSYSVGANPSSSARSGTLTIAGQTFTVNQSGVSCAFVLGASSTSLSPGGGSSSLSFTGTASDCPWTAVSNAGFITITSATSGTGNGTVNYSVAANPTAGARSGTITIAGQTFTVNQLAPMWVGPVGIAPSQTEIKTWTLQGRTYAYVILRFPNAGYRVTNWGQAVRAGNDFSTDVSAEWFSGASVQAVTTTAQIYDLGVVADGNYTFYFNNSTTLDNGMVVPILVKSQAFTVSSVTAPANPIDAAREFVRQQYRDFLNREADQAGEDFWTDNITLCSDPARRPLIGQTRQTEAECTLRQRETTSGAFFLSPESQYTGYFVYRMYQGALGRQPKLSEFTPEAQFVGAGIIVNGQLSAAKINQNKADFAQQFVNCTDPAKYRCAEFKAIYDGLSNQQYVDALFVKTGVNASASDRATLVNGLSANPATETRASVLQKVVDGIVVIAEGNQQFTTTYGQAFYTAESNRAFVQLEYFGYMKRDPDEAGYAFWLGKLNQFNGNFVNAEMVLAFISSPEYRARFGQP